MGLLSKIFSNTRKPEGFFGRMMVNGMNGGGHARMAEWGLSFIDILVSVTYSLSFARSPYLFAFVQKHIEIV